MIIRTSLLLQSLMVGMVPQDDSSSSSSSESLESNYIKPRLTPIPDPKDAAKMARFIVHQASKI